MCGNGDGNTNSCLIEALFLLFMGRLIVVTMAISFEQEIVVGSNMDKIYLVMDFVEHDLKALMESMKTPFAIGKY